MKTHCIVLAFLPLFLLIAVASASWSSMGSGYAVTSNWHGIDVPVGKSVTVWAGTTNPSVRSVEFRWNDPAGELMWDVTVSPLTGPIMTPNVPAGAPSEIVEWANGHPGLNIFYASDTKVPDLPGDWGVQAIFRGYRSQAVEQEEVKIAIRATSFNVIPEVPIIGTIGAAAMMLVGIGLFNRKRKVQAA